MTGNFTEAGGTDRITYTHLSVPGDMSHQLCSDNKEKYRAQSPPLPLTGKYISKPRRFHEKNMAF